MENRTLKRKERINKHAISKVYKICPMCNRKYPAFLFKCEKCNCKIEFQETRLGK